MIDAGVQSPMEVSQHWSEYLVLYPIPVAALIDEVVVSAGKRIDDPMPDILRC